MTRPLGQQLKPLIDSMFFSRPTNATTAAVTLSAAASTARSRLQGVEAARNLQFTIYAQPLSAEMMTALEAIADTKPSKPHEWVTLILDELMVLPEGEKGKHMIECCQLERWLLANYAKDDQLVSLLANRATLYFFPLFHPDSIKGIVDDDAEKEEELLGQLACNVLSVPPLANQMLLHGGWLSALLGRPMKHAENLALNAALHYSRHHAADNSSPPDYVIELIDWIYSRLTSTLRDDISLLEPALLLCLSTDGAAVEYCRLLVSDDKNHSILSSIQDPIIRRDLQSILYFK